MNQQNARLRVCASCEWIFKDFESCPKCEFAHYGARFVYGNKCYKYAKTQQPWLKKKIAKYMYKLSKEIENANHNTKNCNVDS